jgi:hypothetical protein
MTDKQMTWIVITIMIVCIVLVGAIEDPCATEGLMKGCI